MTDIAQNDFNVKPIPKSDEVVRRFWGEFMVDWPAGHVEATREYADSERQYAEATKQRAEVLKRQAKAQAIEEASLRAEGVSIPTRKSDTVSKVFPSRGHRDYFDTQEEAPVQLTEAEWARLDAERAERKAYNANLDARERLAALTPESVGAESDDYRALPCLRFDDAAQEVFDAWRASLEKRIRSGTMSPALESHLSKYRKLVPTLALICHLASKPGTGPVTRWALDKAIRFAAYLETHAYRAYCTGGTVESNAAKAILSRIRKGDLKEGFTAREVYQNHWAQLSNSRQAQEGLAMLVDYNWLEAQSEGLGPKAKVSYRINPAALAKAA